MLINLGKGSCVYIIVEPLALASILESLPVAVQTRSDSSQFLRSVCQFNFGLLHIILYEKSKRIAFEQLASTIPRQHGPIVHILSSATENFYQSVTESKIVVYEL